VGPSSGRVAAPDDPGRASLHRPAAGTAHLGRDPAGTHVQLPDEHPSRSIGDRSRCPAASLDVARPQDDGGAALGQLAAHLEADAAIPSGDESDYASVHTANSLPLGSVKWKRRPPGNSYAGRTMRPPSDRIFASTSSRRAA